MDYSVGSRVRVNLNREKIVEAVITAIVDKSTGRKIEIVSESGLSEIKPEQIIEVFP
jgi:hypothetical protein